MQLTPRCRGPSLKQSWKWNSPSLFCVYLFFLFPSFLPGFLAGWLAGWLALSLPLSLSLYLSLSRSFFIPWFHHDYITIEHPTSLVQLRLQLFLPLFLCFLAPPPRLLLQLPRGIPREPFSGPCGSLGAWSVWGTGPSEIQLQEFKKKYAGGIQLIHQT